MEGRRGGRKESTEPRAVTWREWGGKELAGDRSLPPPDGLGLPEPPASPLSSGLSPARRDCLCSPHPQWSCSSREPARGSGLPVVCACLCLPDSSSTRSYWGREVRLGEGQADCKSGGEEEGREEGRREEGRREEREGAWERRNDNNKVFIWQPKSQRLHPHPMPTNGPVFNNISFCCCCFWEGGCLTHVWKTGQINRRKGMKATSVQARTGWLGPAPVLHSSS